MKKRNWLLVWGILLILTACSGKSQNGEKIYQIYYVDSGTTGLESESYVSTEAHEQIEGKVRELLSCLKSGGEDGTYKSPISEGIEVKSMEMKDGNLSLFFTAAYNSKNGIEEILSRAAIVKTLCQIEGVQTVEFYIEDQPLMVNDVAVGLMTADSFLEGIEDSKASQEKNVVLYFSGEDGRMLHQLTTKVTYNAAEPLAQLLVERIIQGPETDALIPTVPENTTLNSITIRDNICYVDLSQEFNELLPNVKSDVVVYSIVNTLCELPNVNKVQFTIEGEQQEKYGEMTGFHGLLERNLDVVYKETD